MGSKKEVFIIDGSIFYAPYVPHLLIKRDLNQVFRCDLEELPEEEPKYSNSSVNLRRIIRPQEGPIDFRILTVSITFAMVTIVTISVILFGTFYKKRR